MVTVVVDDVGGVELGEGVGGMRAGAVGEFLYDRYMATTARTVAPTNPPTAIDCCLFMTLPP